MMNKTTVILPFLVLVGCQDVSEVVDGSLAGLNPSVICAGTNIGGIQGTANCLGGSASGSIAEGFYVLSSRADNETLDFDSMVESLWAEVNPVATRSVATLKDAKDGNLLYVDNYSVIPRPLSESDGLYGDGVPEKRHYLETIISQATGISRVDIQVCGDAGDIEVRIADCRSKNGKWSFYSGAQYGQVGEGDWSQVIVVQDGDIKNEVWRDERTGLLWSDNALYTYNWYEASGYSRPSNVSDIETGFDSSPGVYQPETPTSVCPDVVDGKIAAGGGSFSTYAPNPELPFKGNLSIADNVIWKLPSIDDYKLADVNGIRKVLPNMEYNFWSSSSGSSNRSTAWFFYGGDGYIDYNSRDNFNSVRCVGYVRK